MIKIIRAKDRYFSDFGWLKTYWLFSFSDYFDPTNIQFGALRVFNDDVVESHTGFPTHPHREMEIVTIVDEGKITHADSMGNETVIGAGEVQRMSAGTGLTHSEFNLTSEPVHFCQIWIFPDEPGLAPSYDQRRYAPPEWRNRLLPVASGQGLKDVVTFHTDATIYRADLDHNHALTFKTADLRRIFLYLLKGSVAVNGRHLGHNDQARIDLEHKITITASGDASFVLIDVPSCKGFGYDEKTLAGEHRG
jgi:redox-sensitive bicupin YhaK (pirin superfamily)